MSTTASVPWWYVASLAGGFTLLGAMVSLTAAWLISRRKNKLDDSRRFDEDIITSYVRLDELADVLHENAGGDPEEEKEIYWDTYREVLRINAKLELLAPSRIIRIVSHIAQVVFEMEPERSNRPGAEKLMSMPELVDDLKELRKEIRRTLRVGPADVKPRLRYRWSLRPSHIKHRIEVWRFEQKERTIY
jgi:hypothetical protein